MRKVIVICLLLTVILTVALSAAESTSLDKTGFEGTTNVQRHRPENKYVLRIKRGGGFSFYRRKRKYVVILKGKKNRRVYKFGLRSPFGKRLTKLYVGVPAGSACYVKKSKNKWRVSYKVKGRQIRRRYRCGKKFVVALKRGLAKKKSLKVASKVRVVRRGKCWYFYRWNGKKWILIRKRCGTFKRGLFKIYSKLKLKFKPKYRIKKIKFGLSHGRIKCKVYPKHGRPIIRYIPCNKKTFKVYQKICTKGRRYGLAGMKGGYIIIGGRRYNRYYSNSYRCYYGSVYRYRFGILFGRYNGKRYICYKGKTYKS